MRQSLDKEAKALLIEQALKEACEGTTITVSAWMDKIIDLTYRQALKDHRIGRYARKRDYNWG